MDNCQAAEEIATHLSKISQEYSPRATDKLPAYLTAQEILKVDECDVAERLYKLKCRKSTEPEPNVQKVCLKVIMGEEYEGYSSALKKCGLKTLSTRREDRCLQYGLKSLLHPVHSKQFPVNPHILNNIHDTRNSEHFRVNWAKSDSYRMSAIPYIQRQLNDYVRKQKNK